MHLVGRAPAAGDRRWARRPCRAATVARPRAARRSLQRLERVEGKWRRPTLCRTGLGALVATDAIRGIHPRGMRRVTGLAARRHLPVRLALVEVHLPPVRVTPCVGAGLEGVLRLHVLVGIVAHAAGATVRVPLGIEVGEALPHGVTGETLLRSRYERALGRVKGREPGTTRVNLWHTMQCRPVCFAIAPSRIFTSWVRWQPCWEQVLSTGGSDGPTARDR